MFRKHTNSKTSCFLNLWQFPVPPAAISRVYTFYITHSLVILLWLKKKEKLQKKLSLITLLAPEVFFLGQWYPKLCAYLVKHSQAQWESWIQTCHFILGKAVNKPEEFIFIIPKSLFVLHLMFISETNKKKEL